MSEMNNFTEINAPILDDSQQDYSVNDYSNSDDYYYQPSYLMIPYIQVDGVLECNINGLNATVKSVFQCFLFRFPFWMETAGMGFLCWGLIIPIILISLFGNFKEQYRWFILNQALWDAFMTYDFQCDKPTHYWFQGITDDLMALFNQGSTNCYYHIYDGNMNTVLNLHTKLLRFLLFSPIFLLISSRFVCLYFNHFYQRHSSTKSIISFIVSFNIFFMFLITIRTTYAYAIDEARRSRENDDTMRKCHYSNCPGYPIPVCNQTAIDDCLSKIPRIDPFWPVFLTLFEYAIPSVTLLLTIIFACAMLYKVGKQLKFQARQQHSPALSSTIRITVICFIQTFTITLMFLFTLVQNLRDIAPFTFNIGEYGIEKLYKEIIPLLFEAPFVRSLNQLRIFFDNLIILLVLNGYRKSCRNFIIIVFKIARNPSKLLNLKEMTTLSVSSTTKITVISSSRSGSTHKSQKF